MNIEDAEKEFSVAKLGDEPPKTVFLSDAEKNSTGNVVLSDDFFQYDRGAIKSFESGIVNGIQDLANYGNRLEVWGGQGLMKVGDILGNEKTTTIGKEMIQVAQHNIDKVSSSMKYASPKELESFANNLGGGAVNYGLIFLTGGLAGAVAKALGASATAAAGIGEASVFAEMFGMSAGQEAQQRIDVYKKRTGDVELKGYTPEMAGKNFAASTLYGVGEGILEKWAFKEQRILFKNPLTMLKTGGIAGLKEGGTEALQSLLDIGVDLADGTITYKELPEAMRGLCMKAAVGATLGFTAGVSVGAAQRSNAIKEMEKSISNTIPDPKERNLVAKEVVDNVINTMQGVIATEAKYSSEFKDAYGDTYNAMQQAAFQAMKDSGGYDGMTEDELAQLSSENAKMFASQVAAEANKRNSLIQDVINSNDIVYDPETKELRLAPKTEESKTKKVLMQSQDVAQRINEIDAEEKANGVPEYTAPTININGVERQTTNSSGEPIAKSEKSLRYFYDWFGDSKVVDEQGRPLVVYHGTPNKIYDILKPGTHFTADKEYADIYQKQGASSAGYKKEAKNPGTYAVYLRMENPFDTRQEKSRNDFYKYYYQQMGMGTDLTEKGLPDWNDGRDLLDFITEYHPELGYDGIILDEGGTGGYGQEVKDRGISYVVKDSNQIKSTSNRGTFSSSENIYYQWEDIGNKTKYTKSEYDLKQLMKTFPPRGELRLMFDKEKGYWFAADSMELIHSDILPQAFKMGLYPEFRTEYDARQYFDDKTYADDGSLVRFIAFGYENNNYMDRIDQMADDYSRAYIIDNGNGNGVILFARYESDLDDANISYLGENAKLYDVVNKRFLENGVLNQEGEDTRDLVVYHSISEGNLRKAIDFGGFAVPSLAITKATTPFDFAKSGITLVGNRGMIDPTNPGNEVYDRDVWSKTFPFETYGKVKKKTRDNFRDNVRSYFAKIGKENELFSLLYYVDRDITPERAVSDFISSDGAKLMYLEKEKGEKVEIPTFDSFERGLEDIGKNYGFDIDKNLAEKIAEFDSYPSKETTEKEILPLIFETIDKSTYNGKEAKYADRLKKVSKELFYKDGEVDEYNIEGLIRKCKEAIRDKGKKEVDRYAVRDVLDERIKNKDEYESWAKKYIEDNLVGEPMVEVGKRKLPFTLENVVKSMTTGLTKNAQESFVYGSGKVIAAGAERLKSIKKIKQAENRLVTVEQEKETREKIEEDMQNFTNEFMSSSDFTNSMYQKEAAYRALGTLSESKNPTREKLQSILDYEFGRKEKYSEELLDAGVNIAKSVRNLGRYYFEAKPQRAVRLNEFSGAIVPTDTKYDDISKKLQEQGMKVVRSDNQLEAVKEFEDVFFQVKGLPREKATPKGTFDAKSKVIQLFEKADASTLDHELAHFWLDNMWTYANSGAASEQYMAQFNAVKDYLGVRPDQRYLTRSQHEKFASAYEKYIYRGEIPNSIMGNVFDNYERFIRNVYNSIQDIKAEGKKKVRLTPEIIKFFDSMIKGGIDTTAATETIASEVRNEEAQKADDVTMKESKEVVAEMPEREVQPEIKPVETEGKAKESRLYERMKGIVGDEGKLEYNVVEIKEQREKARKLWNENPEKARAILNGKEQAEDILRQALYTEQQRLALQNGDTNTFLTSLRKQSAEATRMGQELSALRGVVEDITDPAYWIRSAETEALKNLAKKQTKNLENAMGNSPLVELTARLDADIKALQKDVASKETDEEKTKAFKEGVNAIADKYQGLEQPDLVLNQVDWSNEELADDYIETKVKEKLGIALPKETAKAFIQTARELDTLSRQRDEMGNPVDAFFAKKDELERMRNSHTPTSRTKVLISTIGRANMLTAPATSVLNVVSNSLNYGAENVVRKVGNILEGKTNDNIVSKDLKDKYRAKAWKVFWETGYDMSFMTSLLDERLYKGESISHSEGDGAIRAVGRWAEKYVFSRLISTPDIYIKSVLGFTDYVGNEATDIAYKEGLTGEQAKARADELFKDAIKIEPETEQGQQIRAKAQTDALILTFQQDTKFARMLLDVRNAINKGTGDIGIGDILSPFIKTPANIISMGFDAAVGPFASPVNLIGALNDIKAKNYRSARVLQAAKQTTTAALAYTVIALLASMLIDDDDYIPDYAQLTQKERAAVRAKGGSFGSIKVGGEYISTDFFGPFEMPLVTFLNTRRTGNIIKGIAGGVASKAIDAPVLKDILGSSEAIKEMATSKDDIISAIGENVANAAITRLTPNALNTMAKIIDGKERKTNTVAEKIAARIPFVRNQLQERLSVATGEAQEIQRLNTLLLGSRGKYEETAPLATEISRLASAGVAVNIVDPTRSGELAKLSDEEKSRIQDMFATEFAKKASKEIARPSYRRKSDEDKKDALDDVRKSVVRDIKRKYRNQLKVLKKTKK